MKHIILQRTFTLLTFFFSFTILLNASSPLAPSNLRCCDKINPLGVDKRPYFGWYVNDPDDNEIQTAYQIIVASTKQMLDSDYGDIWNSGKVKSGNQNYVYLSGDKLMSANCYYWKVKTWDKDGNESQYSEANSFVTGLFTNDDWSGAGWIKSDSPVSEDYTYFRKRTQLSDKSIKRAVVYISACHSYELYINGKFVGKGSSFHYPQYTYYNAWDITSFLKSGSENLLACFTTWDGGGQGRASGMKGLLVKTIIEYTDLSKDYICSDNSWKQIQAEHFIKGQPKRNGEGVGRVEKIDSRKYLQNWYSISLDDTSWRNAVEIGSHPAKPWTGVLRSDLTRVIEKTIIPVSVKKQVDNKYVIDLGKIYSGNFKILFSGGVAGDSVKLLGGFVLNEDGTVSTKINQSTKLDYKFILNGSDAIFYPNSYLGLRYLQVENSPNELTVNNVSFISRHFELEPERSMFESSDVMLNKVWELMNHSLVVGAQEGFVDTPTREKGAFLGDGWSQAVPSLSTMGDRTMNLRVLNEFLDSQDQYWPDGRLNAVYPNSDGGRDIPDYTQSYLVWVWDYYMQTGNKNFIKENYLKLKKVADYVDACRNDSTGLIHNLKGGGGAYKFGIIDWPSNMRYGYDMSVESRTVINAYAYIDFKIISMIAEVIGNMTDKNLYETKAVAIKEAINKQLINTDGLYIDGLNSDRTPSKHVSQHSNIYPMAMRIVPEKNQKAVIEDIKNRKMNVGMVSLRWLPEALGLAGEGSHLFELYTNTEWDGWAKTISLGGTVTWESWDADITNNSMSHPWGAVGLLAMQQYMLGIKPLEPQLGKVQIKPLDFKGKLRYVKGKYPTDKGDILLKWTKGDNDFQMDITIPDNIKTNIYIPKCGVNGGSVLINGRKINGKEIDDYVFLENIGSGVYKISRTMK